MLVLGASENCEQFLGELQISVEVTDDLMSLAALTRLTKAENLQLHSAAHVADGPLSFHCLQTLLKS